MTKDRGAGEPLAFRFVPSATVEPLWSLKESDSIATARSRMEIYNVSQLPVLVDKHPTGVVTWQSLGRAVLSNPAAALSDCIDFKFPKALLTSDLLASMPEIERHGYVIVTNENGTVSGIVTSSDLAEEFSKIVGPYLNLEQIESELRKIFDHLKGSGSLSDEMIETTLPKQGKTIGDVGAGIAFGDLINILLHKKVWPLLRCTHSNLVLREALTSAVVLRNNLMHFHPLTANDEQASLILGRAGGLVRDIRINLES
jgi:signal-transduction protein with cAMP-binding, CBS, and nucleotidyltransferase domain